jgi:mannose-6-phosphate isomerase-like protein (cupin superfamily)
LLKQEIISYDKYESGELKVIGYPGLPNSDISVRDKMSYSQWLESYQTYPIIKVEGLERVLDSFQSVHLFYNQKSRHSFKWHTDPVDVQLHVIKGTKFLQVKDKNYKLVAGQSARIPKNYLHRAYSIADTWALSIES